MGFIFSLFLSLVLFPLHNTYDKTNKKNSFQSFQILKNDPGDQSEAEWVDSVFYSLTDEQRIAQLMVVRESNFDQNGPVFYTSQVKELISKYNIGSICLFQGEPEDQARLINEFQAMAQTPIMVAIDGEWGLGMRMKTVKPLRRAMMLGAANDSVLSYEYGRLLGRQMRRMGIHVDYAPVVDINNNPLNPVINDRSLGENKYKVARLGMAIVNGIQGQGVIATIKHFPGHGDVSVDSHLDLPVINKTLEGLDTLELYPFKKIIDGGVAGVMVAHLNIPALDSTPHIASSISRPIVTGILRDKLDFEGLIFTDALEMKGVAKYFPGGEITVLSLIAGNDMLCLPEDVPTAIEAIKKAIDDERLSWNDIYDKCKKVLRYKYRYNIYNSISVDEDHIIRDLNKGVDKLNRKIAEKAITLLNNKDDVFFPLKHKKNGKTAYIGAGIMEANHFDSALNRHLNTDSYFLNYGTSISEIDRLINQLKDNYSEVVIGLHNYSRFPSTRFGISESIPYLITNIQKVVPTIVFDFGNPYAIQYFSDANNLVACYEDDPVTQDVAAKLLWGKIRYKGTLSVTVTDKYQEGFGIRDDKALMEKVNPEDVKMNPGKLSAIDSIIKKSIEKKAFPGAVVLAAKDGKIFYEKAFGTYNYGESVPVSTGSVFDLASITKVLATTLSIMKLKDEGKLDLDATLGTYLPWVGGTDKQNLKIRNILLHQAGLKAYIPFYKNLIDKKTGEPLSEYFRNHKTDCFSIQVARDLYLRSDYEDSLFKIILNSRLGPANKYIYSDLDFIFLGKVVEAISGMGLDEFATRNFYIPMGLKSIGFLPLEKTDTSLIVPTQFDSEFRMQHLRGFVHDPGAALLGGVSGHAGLFGSAEDIAALLQMLLNGGNFNGKQYISTSTIKKFTSYDSPISRRGYGFDKPEKDNYTTRKKHPYPSRYASPQTYGHTGYTGTAIWVDPKYNLIYIFLSNRVNPDGGLNREIYKLNTRGAIEDSFYRAMLPVPMEVAGGEGK